MMSVKKTWWDDVMTLKEDVKFFACRDKIQVRNKCRKKL